MGAGFRPQQVSKIQNHLHLWSKNLILPSIEWKQRKKSKIALTHVRQAYDKIFGDRVDMNQWIHGLNELKVYMKDEHIKDLFLILAENEKYIDKSDWILFLMTSFKSKKLTMYKTAIVTKVR